MSDELIKTTVIDGIAATEDKDSQNEILHLSGADISQMAQKGYFNDNHSSGFLNTLGKITYAKKILKEEDVRDDRQKHYWQKMQRPFLYVKGYLFDEGDHANAKALATIMKEFKKMGTPLSVQMSVEGKVIKRDDQDPRHIAESVIRNVALTLVPANDNTATQIISEEARQAVLTKCKEIGANADYADVLMKGMSDVQKLTTTPGFIEISDENLNKLENLEQRVKELHSMVKMVSAGYGSAGNPTSRTGGAAIMSESTEEKPKSTTFELPKEKRKETLKQLIRKVRAELPDLSYGEVVEYALEVFRKKVN